MTVSELVEKLKQFPPDTRVVYHDYESLSRPGFDIDTVELCGPDEHRSGPPSEPDRYYEELRIEDGRDKPWVLLS